MITGSHHQQITGTPPDDMRLLGQLPGAYLIAEKRWIPRRAAVLHPPTRTAVLGNRPLEQHVYRVPRHHGRPSSTHRSDRSRSTRRSSTRRRSEFGIACEACHGPSGSTCGGQPQSAAALSAAHLSGRRRSTDGPADAPRSRSSRRRSAASATASGSSTTGPGSARRTARGLPYRPGDELASTRFVAQPTRERSTRQPCRRCWRTIRFVRDSFWSDGMVRVSGREYNGLIESPCFRNATTSSGRCPASHATRCTSRLRIRVRSRNGRTISWRPGWTATRPASVPRAAAART